MSPRRAKRRAQVGGGAGASGAPGGLGGRTSGPGAPTAPTGTRAARRRDAAVRRLPIIVVVLVALVAVALVDQRHEDPREVAQPTVHVATGGDPIRLTLTGSAGIVAPAVHGDGALASTWFCAGGTGGATSAARVIVVITNPTGEAGEAVVTAYAGAPDSDANAATAAAKLAPVQQRVEVPASSRATVDLFAMIDAPFVAALVETTGQMIVEQHVAAASGPDAQPCATSATGSWFFATGSTAKDARQHLSLFNPFADDAVVDVVFATSDGFRAPGQYQGLIVPAGHLVVLDLLTAISRHDHVAISVVARSGRLVAARTQGFDGTGGTKGTAVTLGSPEPARQWWFADGNTAAGLVSTYTIYNPSTSAADVEMGLTLDDPDVNGEIDPIPLSVPAQSYLDVVMNDAQQVPIGLGHSVVFRSANDVPVVVERRVVGVSPSPRSGLVYTPGSPVVGRQWFFASGSAAAAAGERLAIVNPSRRAARLEIAAIAGGQRFPIKGLDGLTLAAGERTVVDLAQQLPDGADVSLVVDSTQPVVVERRIQPTDNVGISEARGVVVVESDARR